VILGGVLNYLPGVGVADASAMLDIMAYPQLGVPLDCMKQACRLMLLSTPFFLL
jgi:hypothetical protein